MGAAGSLPAGAPNGSPGALGLENASRCQLIVPLTALDLFSGVAGGHEHGRDNVVWQEQLQARNEYRAPGEVAQQLADDLAAPMRGPRVPADALLQAIQAAWLHQHALGESFPPFLMLKRASSAQLHQWATAGAGGAAGAAPRFCSRAPGECAGCQLLAVWLGGPLTPQLTWVQGAVKRVLTVRRPPWSTPVPCTGLLDGLK